MRIGGAAPEAASVALSVAVPAALTIRPDSGRVAVFAATRLVVVDDVKAEAEVRADLIDNLRHRGDYVPPSSPQPSAALVRAEIILRSV